VGQIGKENVSCHPEEIWGQTGRYPLV